MPKRDDAAAARATKRDGGSLRARIEAALVMHYLNTTRHVRVAVSDQTVRQLISKLNEEIAPTAGLASGMQSIAWLLSSDRLTLQAYSAWLTADEAKRAAHHELHLRNSALINELLGGLAQPQVHTQFELIAQRSFV